MVSFGNSEPAYTPCQDRAAPSAPPNLPSRVAPIEGWAGSPRRGRTVVTRGPPVQDCDRRPGVVRTATLKGDVPFLPRHGVDPETLPPPSMVPLKDPGSSFGDAKRLILNLRISLSLLPKLEHALSVRAPRERLQQSVCRISVHLRAFAVPKFRCSAKPSVFSVSRQQIAQPRASILPWCRHGHRHTLPSLDAGPAYAETA